MMEQPQFSILIAARSFSEAKPVLSSLEKSQLTAERYEKIVAVGENPSRQRNEAIKKARGEFLIFLDNDCEVTPAYFAHLEEKVSAELLDILGGPVLAPNNSSSRQFLFQAALGNRFVTGKAASRYGRTGKYRRSNESELILCNAVIRKKLFTQAGLFDEQLYPNEENEWLDRVQSRAAIYYDPDFFVVRPQRASWVEFAQMLFRYGCGRTQQWRRSKKGSPKQLVPLLVLGGGAALSLFPAFLFPLSLLIFLGVVFLWFQAVKIPLLSLFWQRALFPLAGFSIFFFYAVGQIAGFFITPRDRSKQSVVLFNERGDPL